MGALLVLRHGDAYLRIGADGAEPVAMERATVYPESRRDELFDLRSRLAERFPGLEIRRLRITEEAYEGGTA